LFCGIVQAVVVGALLVVEVTLDPTLVDVVTLDPDVPREPPLPADEPPHAASRRGTLISRARKPSAARGPLWRALNLQRLEDRKSGSKAGTAPPF
jgi:hypothetical protein